MNLLWNTPELRALDTRRQLVRIPPELDVPLTDRVRRLIDTPQFRRLARISQLGLVSLVYPAAHHTRFEHSLGAYRLALLYLQQLAADRRFADTVGPERAGLLIAAALLHDVGHWAFGHPIEDLALPGVPTHEQFAARFLRESELAEVLWADWRLEPDDVFRLIAQQPHDPGAHILASMLSGPIDVDKMDYLYRDSLHAGVPYGRNFDQQRLLGSLCLNRSGDGLALTEKGRTAAELMVFARYVMFSEVYWHHAVRAATAMFQRAFYLLYERLDLEDIFSLDEQQMIVRLQQAAAGQPAGQLLTGLFGAQRRLYKRLAQYSFFKCGELYERLARQPYARLTACAERFAESASRAIGQPVEPHEVLFDAPPRAREVQCNVEIFFPKEGVYRMLAEVSPVVRTLATEQFDDYVKRVRIFIHPRLSDRLRSLENLNEMVEQAAEDTA